MTYEQQHASPLTIVLVLAALALSQALGCAAKTAPKEAPAVWAVDELPGRLCDPTKLPASDTLPVEPLFQAACTVPSGPVTLRGVLQVGPRACTRAYCPGTCCNSCFGGQAVLAGASVQVVLDGIQCGGNECAIQCPGVEPGKTYEVTGTLTYADAGLAIHPDTMRLVDGIPHDGAEPSAGQPDQPAGRSTPGK